MQGSLSADRPSMAAVSSMRLFVVSASPPDSSFSKPPQRSMAAQPPGPGLPRQAPSVKISTDLRARFCVSMGFLPARADQ